MWIESAWSLTIQFEQMLSIYVQIHETSPGSLRGIRKNVQLSIKINNTNPSSYYNDFGVGKSRLSSRLVAIVANMSVCIRVGLQPVWFSESTCVQHEKQVYFKANLTTKKTQNGERTR